MRDGSVVIAAITSCTNTSNPSVMLAAGLLAKKAVEAGLATKPWVKTSLAPGSRVVTDYLERAGLTPLPGRTGVRAGRLRVHHVHRELGAVARRGCARRRRGRPERRRGALGEPQLRGADPPAGACELPGVSAALRRVRARRTRGHRPDDRAHRRGRRRAPVFLADIWPTPAEVEDAIARSVEPGQFEREYARIWDGDEHWAGLPSPAGPMYEWDPDSTYVREPPFVEGDAPVTLGDIDGARVLIKVGDSITTDHISPAGAIKADSPAGEYLREHGVEPRDFNSYGARRGNHEVMMRGTFANIRLRNELAPGTEGPWTTFHPTGETMWVFDAARPLPRGGDAARRDRRQGVRLGFIARLGREGAGTPRRPIRAGRELRADPPFEPRGHGDPPAAVRSGGVRRIARPDRPRDVLGARPRRRRTSQARTSRVEIEREDGSTSAFTAIVRIDGAAEVETFASGGLLRMVLQQFADR